MELVSWNRTHVLGKLDRTALRRFNALGNRTSVRYVTDTWQMPLVSIMKVSRRHDASCTLGADVTTSHSYRTWRRVVTSLLQHISFMVHDLSDLHVRHENISKLWHTQASTFLLCYVLRAMPRLPVLATRGVDVAAPCGRYPLWILIRLPGSCFLQYLQGSAWVVSSDKTRSSASRSLLCFLT